MNKWNALNKVKINHLEIGMCPICARRLTSECEHRTDESEVWYAAQILAEQELYVETLPEVEPWNVMPNAKPEFGGAAWFAGIDPIPF